MVASEEPATYEDLLAVPAHLVAEIVNGELVVSPRPAYRHARVRSRLGGALDLHLGPGGAQVVVPDLAGWRRERMAEVPDVAWHDLAPDWICEVASPATASHDRIVKSAIYLKAGVQWMWLVTPVTSTIDVFERSADGARWTLATAAVGPEPRQLPPFEVLELDVGRLWSMR